MRPRRTGVGLHGQDILALANNLNLDLGALTDLLLSGTGRSFALEALTGAVTTTNADHLKVLQIVDMDIFGAAMTSLGQDVTAIDGYARAGVRGLPSAAHLIAGGASPWPVREGRRHRGSVSRNERNAAVQIKDEGVTEGWSLRDVRTEPPGV